MRIGFILPLIALFFFYSLVSCTKNTPAESDGTRVEFKFHNYPLIRVVGDVDDYRLQGSSVIKENITGTTRYHIVARDTAADMILEIKMSQALFWPGTWRLTVDDGAGVYLRYQGVNYSLFGGTTTEVTMKIISIDNGVVNAVFTGTLMDYTTGTMYNITQGRITNVKIEQ